MTKSANAASKRSTQRVQLELPDRSMKRLKNLKEETEAGSYAEVIKNALMAYVWLIESNRKGETLMIKNADGEVKEIEIFAP